MIYFLSKPACARFFSHCVQPSVIDSRCSTIMIYQGFIATVNAGNTGSQIGFMCNLPGFRQRMGAIADRVIGSSVSERYGLCYGGKVFDYILMRYPCIFVTMDDFKKFKQEKELIFINKKRPSGKFKHIPVRTLLQLK